MKNTVNAKSEIKKYSRNIELNESGIDLISELVFDFLSQAQTEHRDSVRLRLTVEEILLLWRSRLDECAQCRVRCSARFGRTSMTIAVPGAKMDPAEMAEDDNEGFVYSRLLAQAGIAPSYEYKNGENRLVLAPAKAKGASMVKKLLLPFAAAILLGLLCCFLPPNINAAIGQATGLVLSKLIGILSALAGPLIFLGICVGILNVGDVATFSRVGKTIILRFLCITLLVITLTALCAVWFFLGGDAATAGASGTAMQLITMLLDIIPSNILAPFVSGNTLQIIFIAVCLGITALVLGEGVSELRAVIMQASSLVQTMMRFVSKHIGVLVFVSVFSMMCSDIAGEFSQAFKGVFLFIAFALSCPILYVLFASCRLKLPCKLLFKKYMPAYLIAFSTCSSSAALSTVLDTCERGIGMPRHIASFAVPLGQTGFRLGAAISYLLLSFTAAQIYGISITASWVLTMIVTVTLLSFASPPVPGGGFAIYTILFAQAGIPAEAISIAIAWDVVSEFFGTACSIGCMQTELTLAANKLGFIDREILLK